jgi:predicted RNase H-like nuclease (RuvC/YqgF family)
VSDGETAELEHKVEELEAELMQKDQEITTLRFKMNAMAEQVRVR